MENDKKDRRAITSPINGKKGGRPRFWNVNPYEYLRYCKQNPSPESERDIKQVEEMLEKRRRERQKKQVAGIYKRPDLALRQIQYQKDLRKKKLAELRYLRTIVRRLMIQLDEIDAKDLDIERDTAHKRQATQSKTTPTRKN